MVILQNGHLRSLAAHEVHTRLPQVWQEVMPRSRGSRQTPHSEMDAISSLQLAQHSGSFLQWRPEMGEKENRSVLRFMILINVKKVKIVGIVC
jgi:hypothetical protein